MARPANKTSLLAAMDEEYGRLLDQVEAISPSARTTPGACDDWSVKDILAHLDAWHRMFLGWEKAGASGSTAAMPAPGFSWKETPALNADIWLRTKDDEYADVSARLKESFSAVRTVIESYRDADLFAKRRYRWTGSTSVGSYAVSATSSHYSWARKLIRNFGKTLD